MSNSADTTYGLITETVPGTIPATPTIRALSLLDGGATLNFGMTTLNSETLRANRAVSGMRKVAGTSNGSANMEFCRDTTIEDFLAASLSGTYASNVLKAGNTDRTFTIEKTMTEGATKLYKRFSNMMVSKFGLTVEATGKAQASVEFVGGKFSHSTAALTGAVPATPTRGYELAGLDVGTITIAGVTATYLSLELAIDQGREAQFALGQRDAVGVGTSGNRTVTLTVKAYRKDLQWETLFIGDDPVSVSLQLGAGVNGYKFEFAKMVGSVPTDEISSASNIVTVTLTATLDATSGTDATVTLLS